VILSHALWQQRFGSDSTMIGRSIELEGVSRQVIGVMPADFRFPSTKTQIWIPLHNDPRSIFTTGSRFHAGDRAPSSDATLQQARAEIRMFQSQAGALFPWPMPQAGTPTSVSSHCRMAGRRRASAAAPAVGAVALVLLIACTNVANLTPLPRRHARKGSRHSRRDGRGAP